MLIELVVETVSAHAVGGLIGLGLGAAGTRLLAALRRGASSARGAQIVFDARAAIDGPRRSDRHRHRIGRVDRAGISLRQPGIGALQLESRSATVEPRRAAASPWLRRRADRAGVRPAFGRRPSGAEPWQRHGVSPGFRVRAHVSAGTCRCPGSSYPDGASMLTFADRAASEALGAHAGRSRRGIATNVPLSGNDIKSAARVKGTRSAPGESLAWPLLLRRRWRLFQRDGPSAEARAAS